MVKLGLICAGQHGKGEAKIPFECEFENDFCGMTQRADDESDWERRDGWTPTRGTAPAGAKSGSWHIYLDASPPRVMGDTAL